MEDQSSCDQQQLSAPTSPECFQVSLLGFSNETSAREFGEALGKTVRAISHFIDLERLDGVTVAYDYDSALANLDRGYVPSRPLTRTLSDHMIGVAMAPAVLREGLIKGHIVLLAQEIFPLSDEAGPDYDQALYLLAHECGHIEDLKVKDECFPGTILREQICDEERRILDRFSAGWWDEYAACCISAPFGAGLGSIYEKCFLNVISGALDAANEAIRTYRIHADVSRVLEEAGGSLCQPICTAAYLLGHLDGLGEGWDKVKHARDALNNSPFVGLVDRLGVVLRDLWSRRGCWESRAEFERPLHQLAKDVLASGGLFLKPLPDGHIYVDIPYTPETMH